MRFLYDLYLIMLCLVFSVTIVLLDSSDLSSLVYFVILGSIGGMGILLGVCIVVNKILLIEYLINVGML